jgi:hypothetical protein
MLKIQTTFSKEDFSGVLGMGVFLSLFHFCKVIAELGQKGSNEATTHPHIFTLFTSAIAALVYLINHLLTYLLIQRG